MKEVDYENLYRITDVQRIEWSEMAIRQKKQRVLYNPTPRNLGESDVKQ